MAALATGVHPLAAVGGAVFLASDAMIALGQFTTWFTPPAADLWVMLTYVAGQALLVAGVLAADRLTVRSICRPNRQPIVCTGAGRVTPEPSRRGSTGGRSSG